MTASPQQRSALIKRVAADLGLDRCGIAAATPIKRADFLHQWLASGHAGSMHYLHRHTSSRIDVRNWLPWAKSIVVVALNYHQKRQDAKPLIPKYGGTGRRQGRPPKRQSLDIAARRQAHAGEKAKHRTAKTWEQHDNRRADVPNLGSQTSHRRPTLREIAKSPDHQIADPPSGRIAMYAWGEDYHIVLRQKLGALLEKMRASFHTPFQARICVDTSAIVERELAAAAGLGWIGKNTLVLHQDLGSFFFLGEIITELDLAPDSPVLDHCGSCTRCLEACPTQAFPQPYAMDARRCISYLTIEHRGEIEPELASKMEDWVFGCDVCQDVCPYNRDAPETNEPRFQTEPNSATISLDDISRWDDDAYRATVKGKAINRAKLHMWKRNAEIVRQNNRMSPIRSPESE